MLFLTSADSITISRIEPLSGRVFVPVPPENFFDSSARATVVHPNSRSRNRDLCFIVKEMNDVEGARLQKMIIFNFDNTNTI